MWDYEGWDFLQEEVDPDEEIAWRTPMKKKKAGEDSTKPKKKKVKS
jgi:hypothetical protein